MESVIYDLPRMAGHAPRMLARLLPATVWEEVLRVTASGERVEEIRLRQGRAASLTVGEKNVRLSTVLSAAEMDTLLLTLCDGSAYAHAETLACGYLMLPYGVRVGVCGRAVTDEGRMLGVREVSAITLRLPAPVPDIGEEICRLLRRPDTHGGVLVFAPPGVGKTTLLRAVAVRMAGGNDPWRVVLADTRGELSALPESPFLLLDTLLGYKKEQAISIATATLSPQLIVCDEVGSAADADAILAAHSGGVPLLASAHAGSLSELLSRKGPQSLHRAGCFSAYVGLSRRAGTFDFHYDVTPREAVP